MKEFLEFISKSLLIARFEGDSAKRDKLLGQLIQLIDNKIDELEE